MQFNDVLVTANSIMCFSARMVVYNPRRLTIYDSFMEGGKCNDIPVKPYFIVFMD